MGSFSHFNEVRTSFGKCNEVKQIQQRTETVHRQVQIKNAWKDKCETDFQKKLYTEVHR
jgi:hypothetical protein